MTSKFLTLLSDDFDVSTRERGGSLRPGFVAEPVNLTSNIIYMLSGIIALQYCNTTLDYILTIMLMMIGVNSFAAHLHPNKITVMLDNVTIVSFVLAYVGVFLFDMSGMSFYWACGLYGIFILLGYICSFTKYRRLWDSAFDFVPVLVALYFASVYSALYLGYFNFFVSAFLATLAIVARTQDKKVAMKCGTHFLWHIFTGMLLLNLMLTKIVETI